MVSLGKDKYDLRLTMAKMIIPSSQPNAGLTQMRTYTRKKTKTEASIVKRSATAKNAGPLFCFPPGGGANNWLMLHEVIAHRE